MSATELLCKKSLDNIFDGLYSQSDFVHKHVLSRGVCLVCIPLSLITTIMDTLAGMAIGIGAFLTIGKGIDQNACNNANTFLYVSNGIITVPYYFLLNTINIDVKREEHSIIASDGSGFVSHFVIEFLKTKAEKSYHSSNLFRRHIISRLTYPLIAISALVSRVVDAVIGTIAAPLSLLCALSHLPVRHFVPLNNLASRTLQFPGIINDLFFCTIKFINPGLEYEIN